MERKNRKATEYIGFAVLLAIFAAVSVLLPRASASGDMIAIGSARLPVSAFTGVLSALSNMCIICLVVYYGRTGFITAMCALLIQFPFWLWDTFFRRTLTSIPGASINLLTVIAIILIRSRDRQIVKYQSEEVEQLTERQQLSQRLFEQTVTALVTAIDAKDEYSHGHSLRVAEYAERIAWMMGKSEEECRKVYYAGLLHDVGKLGISDGIINKKSELTPEEYEVIKQHPVLGDQILSSIKDYPYIRIGAHYHHERYDGTGYPEGLKGKAIPEIARIISVADTYDTLSSDRSYRLAIPQQLIREEIIAGAGTQFDPEIAMIMRNMIDMDGQNYIREQEAVRELAGGREIHCSGERSEVSEGILLNPKPVTIRLTCRAENPRDGGAEPSVILYDSLDGQARNDEMAVRDLHYNEYCLIRLGGETVQRSARAVKAVVTEHAPEAPAEGDRTVWKIEAVKCKDHVLIRADDGQKTTEVIAALQNNSLFAYLALTGKNCFISDIRIDKAETPVPDDYIPRIAEEISYIDGPDGDIPNVQVDSIRSAATKGIPVTDGISFSFHTRSLPTARVIWHCPYIVLFRSADGTVNGPDYREYAVVRLNGEDWDPDGEATNRTTVHRDTDFRGWNAWKQSNKEGYDCKVAFARNGGQITVSTKNLGLDVRNITTLPEADANGTVYAALTGDQCVLTNIRINTAQNV